MVSDDTDVENSINDRVLYEIMGLARKFTKSLLMVTDISISNHARK